MSKLGGSRRFRLIDNLLDNTLKSTVEGMREDMLGKFELVPKLTTSLLAQCGDYARST